MASVSAVLEAAQAVVAPGPCQVDGAVPDGGLRREAAVFEREALGLLERVGGRRGVAHVADIIEGADLAIAELRLAAAEDEIHGAFDQAIVKILPAVHVAAQVVRQKAVVALDEIGGERSHKESVLGGSEAAVSHVKIVRVDGESDFLSLGLRV